jgi:E3 ubiquitin-protein ligase NEDD4
MGKALFDRHLVAGRMVRYIYKHILGWPITLRDLEMVDDKYYTNLKQLVDMANRGDDISMLCLNFTTTQVILGCREEVELIENGKDIEVNNNTRIS